MHLHGRSQAIKSKDNPPLIAKAAVVVAAAFVLIACGGGDQAATDHASAARVTSQGAAGAKGVDGTHGLVRVQMATTIRPDGSTDSATLTFDHQSARRIIAVLNVTGLPAGTKLSYVRYLDGKFVDSKSATTAMPTNYFHFEFNALPNATFALGQYRLKLYVNEQSAAEIRYRVV